MINPVHAHQTPNWDSIRTKATPKKLISNQGETKFIIPTASTPLPTKDDPLYSIDNLSVEDRQDLRSKYDINNMTVQESKELMQYLQEKNVLPPIPSVFFKQYDDEELFFNPCQLIIPKFDCINWPFESDIDWGSVDQEKNYVATIEKNIEVFQGTYRITKPQVGANPDLEDRYEYFEQYLNAIKDIFKDQIATDNTSVTEELAKPNMDKESKVPLYYKGIWIDMPKQDYVMQTWNEIFEHHDDNKKNEV